MPHMISTNGAYDIPMSTNAVYDIPMSTNAVYDIPMSTNALDCANFELTNHIAYRVENKSLISTSRKLISTAGKLIFQVREYT